MTEKLKQRWQAEFEIAAAKAVREMLSKEPGLVNVRVTHISRKGRVQRFGPLFSASINLRDLDKVKALVEAGADINNSELGTHWPSEAYEINRYLIAQGTEVNQPSYLGFHAIGVTGLDSFFLMMENGLDPNYAWPYNGETMLHVQARHDADTDLARAYALIKAGANVNAQALTGLDDAPIMANEHFVKYGWETPLHFAARLGNKRQVRLLLDHGADPSLKTVSRMIEPNQFAAWESDVTTLIWGLPEYKRVLFEPYNGETPLEMAQRYGHREVAEILRQRTV